MQVMEYRNNMKPNSALTVATLSARPALPAADKVTHLAPPSSHRALL